MKLVDILARELRVWPDGVSAISQGGITGELYDSSFQIIEPVISVSIADDRGCPRVIHDAAIVTLAQWQAAVDALKAEKAVEWNGEGLPPVGAVCEHSEDDNKADSSDGSWKRVKIVGHHRFHNDEYLCAVWVSGLEVSYSSEGAHFRPIRAPEQIAAEELQKEVSRVLNEMPGHLCTTIETIRWMLESGYRKFEIVDN